MKFTEDEGGSIYGYHPSKEYAHDNFIVVMHRKKHRGPWFIGAMHQSKINGSGDLRSIADKLDELNS